MHLTEEPRIAADGYLSKKIIQDSLYCDILRNFAKK